MPPFTTATDPVAASFRRNRALQVAVAVVAAFWIVAAIAPLDRRDWLLENLLVFVAAVAGYSTYRRWPLSDLSYMLIAVFLTLHIVGAHYTYSKVPAGLWLQNAFDLSRNHYDRIVHFSFGLLITYPMLEAVRRWSGYRGRWNAVTALAIMVGASDLFEIAEWLIAITVSPQAATMYLGMQGDPFDAEKDTAAAHVGAVIALVMTQIAESRIGARSR